MTMRVSTGRLPRMAKRRSSERCSMSCRKTKPARWLPPIAEYAKRVSPMAVDAKAIGSEIARRDQLSSSATWVLRIGALVFGRSGSSRRTGLELRDADGPPSSGNSNREDDIAYQMSGGFANYFLPRHIGVVHTIARDI